MTQRCKRTVTVRSPHGYHLYFKAPNHRVPNSASRIAKGVDIRGDGGYVVGPGSATPDGEYQFVEGRSFGEVELAQAPQWLLNKALATVTSANEAAKPMKIPEAHRERAAKYAEAARQRELDRLSKALNISATSPLTFARSSSVNFCLMGCSTSVDC